MTYALAILLNFYQGPPAMLSNTYATEDECRRVEAKLVEHAIQDKTLEGYGLVIPCAPIQLPVSP